MRRRQLQILLTVMGLLTTAALARIGQSALQSDGGESVRVKITETASESVAGAPIVQEAGLSQGGAQAVKVGSPGGKTTTTSSGDPYCATNSNPEQGFTDTTLKWGTIIPLTGALRPLGEQTARVMKTVSETWLNSIPNIPGPYSSVKWGCSSRPGIFGRKVSLTIFSLNANTDTEALAGMRRLIDQEKVFLVRDCYLESNLMGPATQYQNAKGVPGVWCSYSGMPFPALAKWNFSPGTDPLKLTAIHVGWLINKENRKRLAILADPTAERDVVAVVKKVAEALGHPIPKECIVFKKAQDAPNGERSEIAALRQCYAGTSPTTPSPDSILVSDALNGVFGPLEAKSQGWRGADPSAERPDGQVQWVCLTCWVQSLAELCGDACEKMITDCQALPCIPWADHNKFPAAAVLDEVWAKYLSRDPRDILTYGPAAITGGLGLWLGMNGPNLSRDGLRNTLENLKNWDAGIGPILNTGPSDHYGGKSIWLIKFTGKPPWFDDFTGRFIPLSEVGVAEGLATNE